MKIRVSELCDNLDNAMFENISINESDGEGFSADRIKKIALARVAGEAAQKSDLVTLNLTEPKGAKRSKKRLLYKELLIAMIILSLSCLTVFALNSDAFYKRVFGEDISIIKDNIKAGDKTVSDKNFKLKLESTLLYGNMNYVIVSLQRLDDGDFTGLEPFFSINASGSSSYRIEGKDSSSKKVYYALEFTFDMQTPDENFRIVFKGLSKGKGPHLVIKSNLRFEFNKGDIQKDNVKVVNIPKTENSKKYYVTWVEIYPLGVTISGVERIPKDPIPTPKVILIYKNGSSERMTCLTEEQMGGSFGRNPDDNTFHNRYEFRKLRDVKEIRSVEVDGTEYLLK